MRVEVADMSEFTRRLEEGIFDPLEYEKAFAWTKRTAKKGRISSINRESSAAGYRKTRTGKPW